MSAVGRFVPSSFSSIRLDKVLLRPNRFLYAKRVMQFEGCG
ncbi:hypothetical protein EIKCOROL_01815 [Eikenella corrodens ATCC 23834]|uniref:Uncharacterized protein n=1 Tax=Eikenella corrodens ATCC 23834 TaxID=546274 RepID=C0DWR2_EIKCO|nr:hypothetical protein EIKCOROL_01815 [Eikenella corrodens ATCC 23834]